MMMMLLVASYFFSIDFLKEILRISLFRDWSSNIHGFCFIKFSKVVKVSNISGAKNRILGTHGENSLKSGDSNFLL